LSFEERREKLIQTLKNQNDSKSYQLNDNEKSLIFANKSFNKSFYSMKTSKNTKKQKKEENKQIIIKNNKYFPP
jgi:hypothetical protein